jgi:uncharacterized membrane protein YhaH (DUF805 family)
MNGLSRRFFSVDGRATRGEWWLVNLVVVIVLALIAIALMAQGGGYSLASLMVDQPLVAGVVGLVMWLLTLPVSIRRARDRRLSLWWLVAAGLFVALSAAVVRIADRADLEIAGNLLQLAGLFLSIFLFVQFGLLDSKDAPTGASLTDAAAPDA